MAHIIQLAAVALALGTAPALSAQDYGGMAALPGLGGDYTGALAISADGTVIVGYGDTLGGVAEHACRWTAAGVQEISGPGGTSADARAVSADGLTLAGTFYTGSMQEGYLWSAATGYQVISVPGQWVRVRGLSADGSIAVGYLVTPTGTRAFRWTAATGIVDLGTFGGSSSQANAVTPDGSVIVGMSETGSRWLPFRWTAATGLQPLPVPSPPGLYTADAISADGQVVVGRFQPPGGLAGTYRALRWVGMNLPEELGQLGAPGADAQGVDADGDVVVGIATASDGRLRAFRWTPQTGMQDLGGLQIGFSFAFAVSANGDIVVGQAQTGRATFAAFRWERGLDVPLGSPGCAALPNSTGAPARLTAFGSNLPAANDVTLRAEGLPPQALGYFLTSRTPGSTFPVSGSQGILCLGGAIGRFVGPGQVQFADPSGSMTLALDLGALPQPTGFEVYVPAVSWYFQCWYRDANPSQTSNFTESLMLRLM